MKRLKLAAQNRGRIDYTLLAITLILTVIGLIMVYDVSIVQAFQQFGDKYYYIKQQLVWVALGLICMFGFSVLDYHVWRNWALPFFVLSFLLLLAVFIPGLGVVAGGAHRWLKLGPVTIQPTEIIKLTSIFLFASLFEKQRGTGLFIFIVVLVALILGVFQKDLGSTIVFFLTSMVMFILAGAPMSYFITSIPLTLLLFTGFIMSSSYRRDRIAAFFNPFSDIQGSSYHISQVLIALGSGNWFGLGLGQSRQKFYIPEATTDSIFSIMGEEFGFVGAVVLIILLSSLIYRGFRIAEKAEDDYGKFLGFGLTLWLGIQAALNLAAMVSLVPLTGVPLPFISYGGSALLANLVAVGILLNISKTAKI